MVHAEEMLKKHPVETLKYFLKPHKVSKDERRLLDNIASGIRKIEQDIELFALDHHRISPDIERQLDVIMPLMKEWFDTYGREEVRREEESKGLGEVVP
jgi:hypothetical protein